MVITKKVTLKFGNIIETKLTVPTQQEYSKQVFHSNYKDNYICIFNCLKIITQNN